MINKSTWTMPEYAPFFCEADAGLRWVSTDFYDQINAEMEGQIAMTRKDAAILAQAIENAGKGDYLEIGSLFGGSAILVALVQQVHGWKSRVYCIDDLEMSEDPEIILRNASKFGVEDRLEVYLGKSNPFPFENRRFTTTLIDAGHDYGNAIADWNNARNRTDRFVIFHDYDPSHPGVVQAARQAAQDWIPVYLAQHTIVLERPQ